MWAWSHIMSARNGDPLVAAFRSMFPNPDFENFGFTPIHKVVLEISSIDLNQTIRLCPRETIDQPDGTGTTPLMWAASRGNDQTLRSLLLNGASINKASHRGSALHTAALSSSYECVDLLIRHGADPNICSQRGENPLTSLIYSGTDDVRIVELLVSANININRVTNEGGSPLIMAIQFQQQQIATKLIHLNANIENRENDGTNGLYMATYFNLHGIIRLLLDRGCDHTGVVQDSFESYLHLIADRADHHTLSLLTNALAPRDIYYKRKDGVTALDIARSRSGVDSSWHDAFNAFIGSVYQPTNAIEEINIAPEVFVDALEQQP